MGVIYSILNKVNNKRYIGSAINFKTRKKLHLYRLRHDFHHSILLQRAWEKYGEENFQFLILEDVDENYKLLEREQWWLDNTPNEYNICKVAGSSLGVKRSEETKEKLRKVQLGRIHPEWRNKLKSESQGGDKHWTKSKSFSETSRKKMSDSQKEVFATGFHPRHKKIKQYTINGDFIEEFKSIQHAAKANNLSEKAVGACVRGKSKTSGGYKWEYSKD